MFFGIQPYMVENMDKNKRQKLAGISYTIRATCSLCQYSRFPHNDWGTCKLHLYSHEKHTKSRRELSIHKSGWCDCFDLDPNIDLGGFSELFEC